MLQKKNSIDIQNDKFCTVTQLFLPNVHEKDQGKTNWKYVKFKRTYKTSTKSVKINRKYFKLFLKFSAKYTEHGTILTNLQVKDFTNVKKSSQKGNRSITQGGSSNKSGLKKLRLTAQEAENRPQGSWSKDPES